MSRPSTVARRPSIPTTILRIGLGLACATVGLLTELGLDQVVVVAPWLVVAFAAGLVAALLGGRLGGVVAASVGVAGQSFVIERWLPAGSRIDGTSWQIDVVVAAAALVGGLWLRRLILHPMPLAIGSPIRRIFATIDRSSATVDEDEAVDGARPEDLATVAAALADRGVVRTPAQIADALARHAVALAGAGSAVVYVARDGDDTLVALGRSGPPDPSAPDTLPARIPEPAAADGRVADLPIQRGSTLLGVLRLRRRGRELRFGPLLDVVIALAADGLERGRLQADRRGSSAEAAGALGRLGILSNLAAELVGGTTAEEAARTLVDLAIDDLGAGFAVVHVAEPRTGQFDLVHARGYPAGLVAGERSIARAAVSPVALAAATGEPVEVLGEDGWRAAFPTASNVPAITGVRAITALPMRAGPIVHGVLTIGWRSVADRGRSDPALLVTAAAQGAQALERAVLHAHDEDARRFQEAFVGVVSHELRTPITTILAGSRLLRRRLRDDPSASELTGDIEAEADRLSRIVDDLLVLSRLERRHLTVGDEPVHLGHLLNRIVRSEAAHWPTHRFRAPPSSGSPVVLGDETYVEQILRNLISNAAKYSPSGSLVEVSVDTTGDGEVRVRVLDEGPGVAPAEVDDLFSLFYRSPSTAASAAGAGIGLFVSRRLVAEMGGRMWAQPRPGQGSEFGFSLERYPIDDPEPDELGRGRGRGRAASATTGRAED